MKLRAVSSCVLACALLCGGALAQVDDTTKNAARTIGEEGIHLYDDGKYEAALDRFVRADALVAVPTLSLRAGQCLEKLGRLVEASERYLRAAMLPVDTNAPRVFQEGQVAAKDEAARARAAVLLRLAHLRIVADGADTLTIDGKAYSVALIGTSIPVDPGERRVNVSGVERIVTLVEGEDTMIEIVVPHRAAPPLGATQRHDAASEPPSTARTAAWVFGGVGVTALGVGIAAGVTVFVDKGASDAECPSRVTCTKRGAALMSEAQTLAWVANIGVGLGVASLATSVVLLLLPKPTRSARLTPWGVPGGAGIAATF